LFPYGLLDAQGGLIGFVNPVKIPQAAKEEHLP
jgi:hypothetical protein